MSSDKDKIFEPPKLNQISVHFAYSANQTLAQSKALIDDLLSEYYFPSDVLAFNGPPEADLPIFSLSSQHGFSNILMGLGSTLLTVQLSSDWQEDPEKSQAYALERARLIWKVLGDLGIKPFFTGVGLISTARAQAEDQLLDWLGERLKLDSTTGVPHELQVRYSTVESDHFYNNVALRNYRTWSTAPFTKGLVRFSSKNKVDQGLEISVEVNDRHAFNEDSSYFSDATTTSIVICRGFEILREWHSRLESNR